MDSPQTCSPCSTTTTALLGRYVRLSAWFVLAAAVLWAVGIEVVYAHVSPWYALWEPQFDSFLTPVALGIAGAVLGLFWMQPRARRPAVLAGGLTALALLAAAAWLGGALTRPRHEAVLAARHMLVLACFSAYWAGMARFLTSRDWPRRLLSPRDGVLLLTSAAGFLFIFSGVMASTRAGVAGIAETYSRVGVEYIHDIGKGGSIRGMFRNYLDMLPHMSLHTKAHPPGALGLIWLISYAVGRSPMALSLATMAVASAAVVPLYYWTRDMLGQTAAVTAAILYPLAPTILLFTATSLDAAFLPFVLLTLFLFWRSLHRSPLRYGLAAGVGYGVMSLLSFSLLTVGAFFGIVGLWRLRSPECRARVFETAALMLLGLAGLHLAVYWWSGFDIFACFQANMHYFNLDQYALDIQEPRFPWYVYKLTNPPAVLFFAGVPSAVLCFMALRHGKAAPAVYCVQAAFLVTILLYLGRGEAERSAMYTVPFVVVPAAWMLGRIAEARGALAPVFATAAFMAAQCWFIESFFYLYW